MCVLNQSCRILCDPTDCSPPGSSVYGIFQARILEWVVISSSKVGIFPTCISCIEGRFFTAESSGNAQRCPCHNSVNL